MAKRRKKNGGNGNGRGIERQGRRGPQAAAAPRSGSAQAAEATARPSGRQRWWERDPGRLEQEVRELTELGYEPQQAVEDGRLLIRSRIPIAGRVRDVSVHYPDFYPYFRFEAVVHGEPLFAKHQNPYAGNLCLLDRSTAAWDIDMTAASLLPGQIAKIEQANATEGTRPDVEVAQAEPVSTYFDAVALPTSLIVLSPECYALPARAQSGTLTVRLAVTDNPIRGYVSRVDNHNATLPPLDRAFAVGRTLHAPWIRLGSPPSTTNAREIYQRLLGQRRIREPRFSEGSLELIAITFPEDVTYGAARENGWFFLAFQRAPDGVQLGVVRAERFDPVDQAARTPALTVLRKKTITLFGLGGLGAPLGHLLMQMRIGQLRLIDPDLVSLGNAVRWPLGFAAAGFSKALALHRFAEEHYPETRVQTLPWRIGASALGGPDEQSLLEETLAGTDLVIDATAELGVQLFLADLARTRGLPFLTVEAREGGYAGAVVRYDTARPGCYHCFKEHQEDGRFVLPHDATTGMTQPRGCATRTFTGAAFDLVPIAALAARFAAQTLLRPGFPDPPYDIALLHNRTDDDGTIGETPRWAFSRLDPHPRCPFCSLG